jgi:hypothetical protein
VHHWLTITAIPKEPKYETGIKVSDEVMNGLNLTYHDVCPQWNYTIHPRSVASVN